MPLSGETITSKLLAPLPFDQVNVIAWPSSKLDPFDGLLIVGAVVGQLALTMVKLRTFVDLGRDVSHCAKASMYQL